MYVKRRARSSRPASTRKRGYRKKTFTRSARVTTGLKSYVKRAISRTEEMKTQSFTAVNVPMQPYAATNLLTLDCNSVLGLITQGVGEGQRIGNKITCKSFTIKGFINIITSGQYPVIIKMFVGKLKFAISTTQGSYANLYQAGNTVAPPQNNMFDLMRIINKDIFTIYKTKTFKIGNAASPASTANNDFSLVRPFSLNLTKHIGSLVYNDTTANPFNKGLYVWFVCVLSDGSTGVLHQSSYGVNYDMEIKYTDA